MEALNDDSPGIVGRMKKVMGQPRDPKPKATLPHMPGYGTMFQKGRRLLPWTWAEGVLSKTHNYWVATTRSDGRPHVMPVWGVWLDGAFYFMTGRQSRKHRNLVARPNCAVCPEGAGEAVVLEGLAQEVSQSSLPRRFRAVYKKKYGWGDWDSIAGDPFYRVDPRTVFGFVEKPDGPKGNPTRWVFLKR